MMRLGFLFVGSEAGNQYEPFFFEVREAACALTPSSHLYQFQSIGEGDDGSVVRQDQQYSYFKPRPLRNLVLIDELESLCPLTDMLVRSLRRCSVVEPLAFGLSSLIALSGERRCQGGQSSVVFIVRLEEKLLIARSSPGPSYGGNGCIQSPCEPDSCLDREEECFWCVM